MRRILSPVFYGLLVIGLMLVCLFSQKYEKPFAITGLILALLAIGYIFLKDDKDE